MPNRDALLVGHHGTQETVSQSAINWLVNHGRARYAGVRELATGNDVYHVNPGYKAHEALSWVPVEER